MKKEFWFLLIVINSLAIADLMQTYLIVCLKDGWELSQEAIFMAKFMGFVPMVLLRIAILNLVVWQMYKLWNDKKFGKLTWLGIGIIILIIFMLVLAVVFNSLSIAKVQSIEIVKALAPLITHDINAGENLQTKMQEFNRAEFCRLFIV